MTTPRTPRSVRPTWKRPGRRPSCSGGASSATGGTTTARCPGSTIGSLAGHLARGVLTVYWYLDMPEPDPPVITAAEYYASHPGGDLDAEQNQQVLARGAETAKGGCARLYLDVGRAVDWLEERLPEDRRRIASPPSPARCCSTSTC